MAAVDVGPHHGARVLPHHGPAGLGVVGGGDISVDHVRHDRVLSACHSEERLVPRARAEARAENWLYPLAGIITTGPVVLSMSLGVRLEVGSFFLALNGFSNVLCCACQGRNSHPPGCSRGTQSVNFGRTPASHSGAGVSSLPVGFAMQHHEISVAWVQTYALQQSERDTAELAKNASQGDVNSLKQNGITSLCLSSP